MPPPLDAHAVQLRWSTGTSEINPTSATRCTLVVEAESSEGRLPAEWRLLWAADSLGMQFVPVDSAEVCVLQEAHAYRIDDPATPADSAANQITSHYCSEDGEPASIAFQVIDLPAGGHGKIKAVALDPSDSNHVIESNEVTYNGGTDAAYPPVVLHASSIHSSLQLQVTVVGAELIAANAMNIVALDSSWSLPLTITSQTNRSLNAVANVAALLPACHAAIGSEAGAVSLGQLPPDAEPESPESCQAQFFENLLAPPPGHGFAIQPKDFAFARGFIDQTSSRYALHLFYTRQTYYDIPDDDQSKSLGHAWTTDFNSWYGPSGLNQPDTLVLPVRTGKFDELHVWAPTIVQNGPIFYMFYTGVKKEGGKNNQRIGVATSTDLNTWVAADEPTLSSTEVPWAKKNPPVEFGGQQLRDPFVMPDPINPGQWLMYFVAVDSLRSPQMAVGAARSSDLLGQWAAFANPFSSTTRLTSLGATPFVESPHVFARNGQWWMPYTVGFQRVFFETTTSADPADTVAAHWSNPVDLRTVAEGEPPILQYWHASEHLKLTSAAEYLAAFDDNATSIDIQGVFPPTNAEVDSLLLSCPVVAGVANAGAGRHGARLSVSRLRWGRPEVGLRVELPSRMAVRLAVYDVSGRRRATLVDRELSAGTTDVTWDGRDQAGRVTSGVYFVRLAHATGAQMAKIVLLR